MWSRKHSQCVRCGTTESQHIARGLCVRCYTRDINERNQRPRRTRSRNTKWSRAVTHIPLTKEILEREYIELQKSTPDIAREYGYSRAQISTKLKSYGIPVRSLKEARGLAMDKGKLIFERIDRLGEKENVVLQKTNVNEEFFYKWNPEMAYVLGVIYTDGNIGKMSIRGSQGKRVQLGRLAVTQKEPELLQKILKIMGADVNLYYKTRRIYGGVVSGEVYYFYINNDVICDSLIALGVTPKKSLTIKFPVIPQEYVRHFIRGCWDGDGSVFIEKRSGELKASFGCGSKEFIESMVNELEKVGLAKRNIYQDKRSKNFHYFKITGGECGILYKYFYKDVPEEIYLNRKHELFKKVAP